jgi:RNA polymerase sigma-70 factor (ECF subfamily)
MPVLSQNDFEDINAIKATLEGNSPAFSLIFKKYSQKIYHLCLAATGSCEEAEDQTEEIFLKAFKYLKSFDQKRRFFSWLYTIALNHLKKHKKKYRLQNNNIIFSEEQSAENDLQAPQEKEVLNNEETIILNEAVQKLKPDYKLMFILFTFENLSIKEISEKTGLNENTIKTRLKRARENLKKNILLKLKLPHEKQDRY